MGLPTSYIRHPMPGVGHNLPKPRWYAWILDDHWDFGAGGRTYLGQLVYEAKYHGSKPSLESLKNLSVNAVRQIRSFSGSDGGFLSINGVIAVPSSSKTSSSEYSVAGVISQTIANDLGVRDLSNLVDIQPGLGAAKLGTRRRSDDFVVRKLPHGSQVLIVDDLFSTGNTMIALATILGFNGAGVAAGFALTKVKVGLGN